MKLLDAPSVDCDFLHPTYAGIRKSEIDATYFAACRSGEIEHTKKPERDKVVRFILDHHPSKRFRLLTNPGCNWTFERQIESELGEYAGHFIGIERSWSILNYGLRWMPGKVKHAYSLKSLGEEILCYMSRKATIVHTNIEHVLKQLSKAQNEHLHSFTSRTPRLVKEDVLRHFSNFSGAWIDIWSPLGRPDIARFLRNLPSRFNPNIVNVPFVFSFQYGRDDAGCPFSGDGLDGRTAAIKSELEHLGGEYHVVNSWWYFGPNNGRIATVCGCYQRHRKHT